MTEDPLSMSQASVIIEDTETREKSKKFTVYKVAVSCDGNNWFIFRRYNEFHALYDKLKRLFPDAGLKLPGKRLFGNLDPDFIRQRREGLHDFIQKMVTHPGLSNHRDVVAFLNADKERANANELAEETRNGIKRASPSAEAADILNLGSSERTNAKPTDFEFLKIIGKGSFGKVLLAKQKVDNQVFAIKVLQKQAIMRRNEVKHIMAERNVLLKNTHHPFLVGLHYSFQTADKLYFVLDYVNGGELFFHLQKERYFAEPRAKFYAAEIGSAIGYLHSLNIIYRDLKPENILLTRDGHVKLTDFGLCKEGVDNYATTSTFCGTPEYLAPEVLMKRPYDRTVDWWCLGAVLYEMLYGLPPFYSRDTSEMYNNILHKPLRLRSNVSLQGRSILDQLLQKDNAYRLGTLDDFNDIKAHPFFASISFEKLELLEISPPYNPNVIDSMDLRNIDPEFVQEPVPASVTRSNQLSASVLETDNVFEGFSYAPPIGEAFDQ